MRLTSLPGAVISGGSRRLKIAGGWEVAAEHLGQVAQRKR
jgi:hypothetical protein